MLKMVKFYKCSKNGENGHDQIKKLFQVCDYLSYSLTEIDYLYNGEKYFAISTSSA